MDKMTRKTLLKAATAGAVLPAIVSAPTLVSAASTRRAPAIMLRKTTSSVFWNYTKVAGPTSEQSLVDYFNTHIGPSKGIHIDLTVFPINSFEEKVDTTSGSRRRGRYHLHLSCRDVRPYSRGAVGIFTICEKNSVSPKLKVLTMKLTNQTHIPQMYIDVEFICRFAQYPPSKAGLIFKLLPY